MQQAATLHASVGGSTAAYHQLTQRVRAHTNGLTPRIKPGFRVFGAGKCSHTRLSAMVSPQLATVVPPHCSSTVPYQPQHWHQTCAASQCLKH
jgi:hypothetical protein